MSEFEKHIGKFKKVDLSKYDNNTEKFFEEQYRKFTKLSEEEIKDAYSKAKISTSLRINSRSMGAWEYLFFDTCHEFGMDNKFYDIKGNIYETIEDIEVEDISFLKDNNDGTYDYVIEFYNGCTWLGECIENELKKIL